MSDVHKAIALATTLIKAFEGCRLKAYKCSAGVWTVGWGETLGVTEHTVWTQAQADAVLQQRVVFFLFEVLKRCPQLFHEPPGRLAACVSLAYNIGLGAFGASSVCRKTAARDYAGAAAAFLLWKKAGGKVLRGLLRRREQEAMYYRGDARL